MYILLKKKISHKNWRKLVKNERRKRIRKKLANEKELQQSLKVEILMKDAAYVKELQEKEQLEKRLLEEEQQLAIQRKREWQAKDLAMHSLWLLNKEMEKKKSDEKKKILEDSTTSTSKKSLLLEATNSLGNDPVSVNVIPYNQESSQSYIPQDQRPKREPCPFFIKTGACRFGVYCSRDHEYPKKSCTLLFPNMYSNFGLEGSFTDDYDTDISLEYSESENILHYKEFFEDVVSELEKFGKLIQFKTCKNKSAHLRGNVYAQFKHEEHAMTAMSSLNGRWYGGKQISCSFVSINKWKSAICGLYSSRSCHKGDHCNFLHVFSNPHNAFWQADIDRNVEDNLKNCNIDYKNKKIRRNKCIDNKKKDLKDRKRRSRSWSRESSPEYKKKSNKKKHHKSRKSRNNSPSSSRWSDDELISSHRKYKSSKSRKNYESDSNSN